LTEVIKAITPYASSGKHLNLFYTRRVKGEGPLDPDTIRDLANGKGSSVASSASANDNTFEGLNAFLVSLDDTDMGADRISNTKLWELGRFAPRLQLLDYRLGLAHNFSLLTINVRG
jgi:hypothetical protein